MSSPKGESELSDNASGLKDPPSFPDGDAGTIKEYAASLDGVMTFGGWVSNPFLKLGVELVAEPSSFSEAAQAMIDAVHDVLGNYEVAKGLALGWAEQSGVPDDVKSSLVDQKGVLDLYWEGGAYDSFVTHFRSVTDELDKTAAAMVKIGETLTETIATIHQTYSSAIEFITGCAAELIGAISLDAYAWFQAIGGVLEKVGTLIADAIEQVGEYRAQVTAIEVSAISFPDLEENSKTQDVLSEPKNWEPAPAPK